MGEYPGTEAEIQQRRAVRVVAREVNKELSGIIPEKCRGCGEATVRAFVLAGRVANEELTLEGAKEKLSHDTGECKGASSRTDVYDGGLVCWRKQQILGQQGCVRALNVFPD